MKLFKNKYTKWIAFGNYTWAGDTCYMVFARKNLRTGMLSFKTKMIHTWWRSKSPFVPKLIDTEKAFNDLINE